MKRCGIVLVGTLAVLASASERRHWRRSDGGQTDPAAVARTLEACRLEAKPDPNHERALAACMSQHGYFTWDGV